MPKARQPKQRVKPTAPPLHEKAAGQLVREMVHSTESPFGVSEERQEEQRAGAAVKETGKAAVLSVYRAGRGMDSAVRQVARNVVRQNASGQSAGPGNASPVHTHQSGPAGQVPVLHPIRQPMPPPEQRGRKLAQARAKQRAVRLRERTAKAGAGQAGTPDIRPGNPAKSPRKPPAPGLRGVSARTQTTAHTASVAAQRARRLAVQSRQAAQTAARGIRAVGQKLAAALKVMAAAAKSLAAALAAGGASAALVVVFICLVAMVAGSAFGIFFAVQPTGNGIALQDAVRQLSEEYHAQIREIEQNIPHDRLEYAPDGLTAIPWQEVLSVFAADMAAENGQPVAVLESAQIGRLEEILWQMNPVSHRTYTEEHEEERSVIDEDGNETTETVTVTKTVLEITIQHKAPQEMADALGFTARQNEQLALLSDPQYAALWMELLGGYVSGGGQILTPGNVPAGSGLFQWPLPEAFRITSGFGERVDPISGESSFHTGTDIAAPEGTPILAAANGTVTLANGTDPWGGGYGYYVKISHGGGMETLYAHCSAICVTPGQTVRQGEVIGYVGSTGNSTGNHLHFEVWMNGSRIDAMTCFAL